MKLTGSLIFFVNFIAFNAWAGPAYQSLVNSGILNATGVNMPLNNTGPSPAANQCLGCHASGGPPLNSYGQALVSAALARGYQNGAASSWNIANAANGLFTEIITDTLAADSDGDGATNQDELTAGSNPGDVSSTPTGGGGGGGGGNGNNTGGNGGGTEILSNQSESSSTSTLSGCGSSQVSKLTQNDEFVSEAQAQSLWILLLILFLPMLITLAMKRNEQTVKVPVKSRKDR